MTWGAGYDARVNSFLLALDPIAVRQGKKSLGDLAMPDAPAGSPFGATGAVAGARRVVVLGDEFAGGWGLASQDETLAARLASRIGVAEDVVWQTSATGGATLRQVHREMLDYLPSPLDMVVLWVGWGDLLEKTTVDEWRRELAATLAILCRTGRVLVVGCPPVASMPRLGFPLKAVLAARADSFDKVAAEVAAAAGAMFAGSFDLGADGFLADGVHLSAVGQAVVADRVGATLWP